MAGAVEEAARMRARVWSRCATTGIVAALVCVLLATLGARAASPPPSSRAAPAAVETGTARTATLRGLERSSHADGASFAGVAADSQAPTLPLIAVSARSALLLDPDTGHVYLAANAEQEVPMASTTKIMTALVALSFGRLDAPITVGADAASLVGTGASVAFLSQGDVLTLRQLLYALLLPSGDDAAVAIADGVAGSQDRFVRLMNLEAALLGLGHTHYANVHGLDAPGHYTTARDLATLTAAALHSPTFAAVVATATYKLSPSGTHHGYTWHTTDNLLTTAPYPGVLGVKTGFTGGAGYCLVFVATRPYGRLLGVLLGEPTEDRRFSDAAALLTWGFGMQRHLPPGMPQGGGHRVG
jgi:serine-type D-Ala-D-Ala carboxypeptidase (penicillin-binding protein 5/6)